MSDPIRSWTIRVDGVPAPQGSKTLMPNGAMVEGSSATGRAKHKAWRAAVTWSARGVWRSRPPLDEPVGLVIRFYLPMPKSRPAKVRALGLVPHAVKPDLDKLIRSTLDGLADAGVFTDDSRVWSLDVRAFESTGRPGATIRVTV